MLGASLEQLVLQVVCVGVGVGHLVCVGVVDFEGVGFAGVGFAGVGFAGVGFAGVGFFGVFFVLL